MKNITRGIWILVTCGIALGLIFGIRAVLRQEDVVAAAVTEQPLPAAEGESESGLEAPEAQPTAVEPIEPGIDLKRGSFLTDEIAAQLDGIVAEKIVGSVWVGASQIVQATPGLLSRFVWRWMAQKSA